MTATGSERGRKPDQISDAWDSVTRAFYWSLLICRGFDLSGSSRLSSHPTAEAVTGSRAVDVRGALAVATATVAPAVTMVASAHQR
jgi:hypothetical protein